MELTRLKRERAVDAVHEALKEAILSDSLHPGERLNVDLLAQKLGVSLTPVRHAIQLLSQEGLVEVKPRSGTFVASVCSEDVRETFEIRCALECMAVEKASETLSSDDLQSLKDLADTIKVEPSDEGAAKAHEANNREFHRILLRAARNRRLLEMYDGLNANIKIARIHASEGEWIDRLEQEQAEHKAIVEALEQRNKPQAVKAMRKHIFRAMDSLLAAVSDNSSNGNQ